MSPLNTRHHSALYLNRAVLSVAFARSWRLALALSSILPCIGMAGAFMNIFISKYMQLNLKYVAESGTVAEEVISTIRTAHAFGNQEILSRQYQTHTDKSLQVQLKTAVVHGWYHPPRIHGFSQPSWLGCGLGVFFFVIYNAYALGLSPCDSFRSDLTSV